MKTSQIQAINLSLSRTKLIGKRWTLRQFQKQFGRHFPKLATIDPSIFEGSTGRINAIVAYTNLNKLLRKRGLAIKSHNYCRSFSVIEDPSLKVSYLASKIKRISAYRNDLATGIITHGSTYSRLNTTEIESITSESDFYPGRVPYGTKH